MLPTLAGGVAYEFGKGTGCFLYPTANAGTENGIATAGGAKAAWFKDSEGNILALVRRL